MLTIIPEGVADSMMPNFVVDESPATYTFIQDHAGKDMLFICKVGTHCNRGQQITIAVAASSKEPPVPSPTEPPVPSPTESPVPSTMELNKGNQLLVPAETPELTLDPTTLVPVTEVPPMDAASVPLSFLSTLCMIGTSMTMIVHFAGY
jgi:hypothetical protein